MVDNSLSKDEIDALIHDRRWRKHGLTGERLTYAERGMLAACTTQEAWLEACEAIREVRAGAYPTDWASVAFTAADATTDPEGA